MVQTHSYFASLFSENIGMLALPRGAMTHARGFEEEGSLPQTQNS